jgi:hypothetical protein
VVGVIVAWHQPRNPMGWVLLGVTFFFLLDDRASSYAYLDYRLHGGRLPLGWLAVLRRHQPSRQHRLQRRAYQPGGLSGERRPQLKWLLSGATVFIMAAIATVWINDPTGLWKVVMPWPRSGRSRCRSASGSGSSSSACMTSTGSSAGPWPT